MQNIFVLDFPFFFLLYTYRTMSLSEAQNVSKWISGLFCNLSIFVTLSLLDLIIIIILLPPKWPIIVGHLIDPSP